jgi:hypothetical protein
MSNPINTSETVAIEYMARRWPHIDWTRKDRFELHREFFARLPRNYDTGKWAVAVKGYKQWGSSGAIGDGITSATASLLTRCETQAEAEAIADAANDLQPGLLPGQGFAWIHEAVRYDITDYLSRQDLRNGRRKCDRRLAN